MTKIFMALINYTKERVFHTEIFHQYWNIPYDINLQNHRTRLYLHLGDGLLQVHVYICDEQLHKYKSLKKTDLACLHIYHSTIVSWNHLAWVMPG